MSSQLDEIRRLGLGRTQCKPGRNSYGFRDDELWALKHGSDLIHRAATPSIRSARRVWELKPHCLANGEVVEQHVSETSCEDRATGRDAFTWPDMKGRRLATSDEIRGMSEAALLLVMEGETA